MKNNQDNRSGSQTVKILGPFLSVGIFLIALSASFQRFSIIQAQRLAEPVQHARDQFFTKGAVNKTRSFIAPPYVYEQNYSQTKLADMEDSELLHLVQTTDADKSACSHPQPPWNPPSIFILDPNYLLDYIPELREGNYTCDIDKESIWPYPYNPWRSILATYAMPDWAYAHGHGYWIKHSIISYGVHSGLLKLSDDISTADIVYTDMHCFHSWWYAQVDWPRDQWDPADYAHLIWQHIWTLPRWKAKKGADWIVVQTHPAGMGVKAYNALTVMCTHMRNVYSVVAEHEMLCREDSSTAVARNAAILAPYVAATYETSEFRVTAEVKRVFIYFRATCAFGPGSWTPRFSSGKLLRRFVSFSLESIAARYYKHRQIIIDSACIGHQEDVVPHAEAWEAMRSSLFCPVIAGDTQSSMRLSEIILAGCIPVFFGPPFHTLPLADVITYSEFSVFIYLSPLLLPNWIISDEEYQSMTEEVGYTPPRSVANNNTILDSWFMDEKEKSKFWFDAEDVIDGVKYLRRLSLKTKTISKMQRALEEARWLHFYPDRPDKKETSPLSKVIVEKICQRAMSLRRALNDSRE